MSCVVQSEVGRRAVLLGHPWLCCQTTCNATVCRFAIAESLACVDFLLVLCQCLFWFMTGCKSWAGTLPWLSPQNGCVHAQQVRRHAVLSILICCLALHCLYGCFDICLHVYVFQSDAGRCVGSLHTSWHGLSVAAMRRSAALPLLCY